MKPRKLPSAGLIRGANLPVTHQQAKDHTEAVRVLVEVFKAPPSPSGPMDIDLMDLEAQALEAAGIPPELLLGYDRSEFGHPIPGGGAA